MKVYGGRIDKVAACTNPLERVRSGCKLQVADSFNLFAVKKMKDHWLFNPLK